ncbi:unnamed protein product, partial [Vitis vinifera]
MDTYQFPKAQLSTFRREIIWISSGFFIFLRFLASQTRDGHCSPSIPRLSQGSGKCSKLCGNWFGI